MRQHICNALLRLALVMVLASVVAGVLLVWNVIDDVRVPYTFLLVAFGLACAALGFA